MEYTSPQAIMQDETLAVETIDGTNTVLWEATASGNLVHWSTDSAWNWTSNFGDCYVGSVEYYTAETQFGVDVNKDGTIGAPKTRARARVHRN